MSEAAAAPLAPAPQESTAAGPAFVIAGDAGTAGDRGLAGTVAAGASKALGFDAPLFGAAMAEAGPFGAGPGDCGLDSVLERCIEQGHDELFLLPFTSGFDLFRRQAFAESVARARRRSGNARIFCDEPDLCEPLPVRAFADSALAALDRAGVPPGEAHLVVVSGGQGDAADRARTYRLMRLIWEEVGAKKGDAAFLYCDTPRLEAALEEGEGPRLLVPAIVAEAGARKLFLRRVRARAAGQPPGAPCLVGDFADGHPNIAAWLQARLLRLWNSHRSRGAGGRQRSVLSGPGRRLAVADLGDRIPEDIAYGPGVVARIFDTESLEKLLDRFGIRGDPVFVILCGTFHFFARLTEPFVDFIRYMPAPAFGALVVAFVGINDAPKVAIIFVGTFFQMVLVVGNTTRLLETSLIEAAQTLGARRKQLILHVIVPGILPNLYRDLRILLGWAWTYLIVAELIGASSGISYFINQQAKYRNYDNVFAAIVMIGIIGLTTDQILGLIERFLFPWERGSRGLSPS